VTTDLIIPGPEKRDWFGHIQAQSGATISVCGQYRYHLWRVWDPDRPIMVFVMCNPSTADATHDDPTIRRCIGFAKRDNYGGISVRNVFALRATNPAELEKHRHPFGPENEEHLLCARGVFRLTRLVAAWGKPVSRKLLHYYQRAGAIVQMQLACCLGTTKGGHPRHPLYVRADQPLQTFRYRGEQ
jgi:hypothetical protein